MTPDFKDIPGFEGRYAINTDGQVWSHVSSKWLVGGKLLDGYRYVCIRKDGKAFFPRVAPLVLTTFVGSAPEGYEVDHFNNIRDDDRLENLQWVTRKDNVKRIWSQGRRTMQGEKNTRARLSEADVLEIRQRRKTHQESYTQLAATFGLRKGHVADIITGRIWSHLPL